MATANPKNKRFNNVTDYHIPEEEFKEPYKKGERNKGGRPRVSGDNKAVKKAFSFPPETYRRLQEDCIALNKKHSHYVADLIEKRELVVKVKLKPIQKEMLSEFKGTATDIRNMARIAVAKNLKVIHEIDLYNNMSNMDFEEAIIRLENCLEQIQEMIHSHEA